jgi:hypothetical protein
VALNAIKQPTYYVGFIFTIVVEWENLLWKFYKLIAIGSILRMFCYIINCQILIGLLMLYLLCIYSKLNLSFAVTLFNFTNVLN